MSNIHSCPSHPHLSTARLLTRGAAPCRCNYTRSSPLMRRVKAALGLGQKAIRDIRVTTEHLPQVFPGPNYRPATEGDKQHEQRRVAHTATRSRPDVLRPR
ncbi:hypothetical protein E2C01_055974 [Portunus trituberculatus]|uniref:Uncharacterized protein n=1 Tax=Portunus trituberculatus TaxID=210409 RepID=A0A5B7GXR2_PORTR|nr:hypothetical protein [Portunus trituberculatus]